MKCKDCPYLIKTESVEIAGWWDLYCKKHDITHCPVAKENLKYLCCVEDERGKRMSDLKPCPFCGSEAVVNYKQALGTWIVECTNSCCPASYMIGMDYDTKLEAVAAWNRRTNDVGDKE